MNDIMCPSYVWHCADHSWESFQIPPPELFHHVSTLQPEISFITRYHGTTLLTSLLTPFWTTLLTIQRYILKISQQLYSEQNGDLKKASGNNYIKYELRIGEIF